LIAEKPMVIDNLSFTAVFVEVPEGGYAAYVEEIPGANTQGESLEEARENLKDALQLVFETKRILC
jgi:predicted RNase H-like HicB family nuclease